MKKRMLWLGLSFLLVAALLLSSCTKTTAPTTVTQTATTTATTTKTSTTTNTAPTQTSTPPTTTTATTPVYGGTLNIIGFRVINPPATWDFQYGVGATDYYTNPYIEYLLTGDFVGKGPRGTNEYPFQNQDGGIQQQYLTGQLAQSYEQPDPLTIIFHIRKGIMWTGNAKIGMAPREFTAADAAFALNRYWQGPQGGTNMYYMDSITATDRYTLVFKLKQYTPDWMYRLAYGYKAGIICPETVAAGPENWRNQSGTGPFIITDYVDGAYATYSRNLNYWGATTINGIQYQTPFIDKLIYPIMPDISSQIAAIRTAKIDVAWGIAKSYESTLKSSSPDLQTFSYLKNSYYQVLFRCDTGIFSNTNVRRAMMIGTDLNAIAKSMFPGGAEINAGPLAPGIPGISTLIDEYPPSTKQLFTYDPTMAKKMLADAGYPNPTVEITCQAPITSDVDLTSLLASQWAKIGVTLKINAVSSGAWLTNFLNKSYSDIFLAATGDSNPVTCLQYKALLVNYNLSNWNDPKAASLFNQALATIDTTAQNALLKQLNTYIIDQCSLIPMPAPYQICCTYPWVKNYYNEVETGYYDAVPIIADMWIDTALKQKLGH